MNSEQLQRFHSRSKALPEIDYLYWWGTLTPNGKTDKWLRGEDEESM
jgi:hypothetical protein